MTLFRHGHGKRDQMKSLPALLAVVLLGMGLSACGSASKGAGSAPPAVDAESRYLNDGDNDNSQDANGSEDYKANESSSYHDTDDKSLLSIGHPADAADRQAITVVVKRYYAAAASGDAALACSMIYKNLSKSIAEDYGQAPGPSYLRGGKTCSAVMSRLFRHFHSRLASAINVTGVRIGGEQVLAFFGSRSAPASYVYLTREAGTWKLASLLGGPMP
jgi:hypothetical protein